MEDHFATHQLLFVLALRTLSPNSRPATSEPERLSSVVGLPSQTDQSKSMTCPLRMLCHVPKHPRHPFDVCLAVAVAAVAHAAGSSAAEHRHRQRLGACPSCNATRSPPTRPPERSIFAFGRSQPGRGAPPSSRGSATIGSCPTQRWFGFRPPSVHSICRPNGPNRDRFPARAIAPTPAPIGLIPCIRPPTGQAIARPIRAAFGWVG